jgi:hypothetical protein
MSVDRLWVVPWLENLKFRPIFTHSPTVSGQDDLIKIQRPNRICSLTSSFICHRSHVHSLSVAGPVPSQSGSPAYIFSMVANQKPEVHSQKSQKSTVNSSPAWAELATAAILKARSPWGLRLGILVRMAQIAWRASAPTLLRLSLGRRSAWRMPS